MSLDPRRVAVTGIGYGALAIATLGFDGDSAVPPAPTSEGGQVVVRKAPKALPAIRVPVRIADVGQDSNALSPTIEVVPALVDVGRSVDSVKASIEIVATMASAGESADTADGRGPIDPAVTLAEAAAIVAWMRSLS